MTKNSPFGWKRYFSPSEDGEGMSRSGRGSGRSRLATRGTCVRLRVALPDRAKGVAGSSITKERKQKADRLLAICFLLCSPNNFEPFPIKQSKNDYIIHIDPNDYSYQCMHYRSRNGVAKAIKTRWDRNKYRSTHHVRFQDKR